MLCLSSKAASHEFRSEKRMKEEEKKSLAKALAIENSRKVFRLSSATANLSKLIRKQLLRFGYLSHLLLNITSFFIKSLRLLAIFAHSFRATKAALRKINCNNSCRAGNRKKNCRNFSPQKRERKLITKGQRLGRDSKSTERHPLICF